MITTLPELLSDWPPAISVPGARRQIREQLEASGKRLVVIDDDPTGTQTVHDVQVYLRWSPRELYQAFASQESVFYVSTNSRALRPKAAHQLNYELGRNLLQASLGTGGGVLLASRSDSTLRGHFPTEVKALMAGFPQQFDGVVIVPAFFEGGRYTVDDVHWVEQRGRLVSADETEFSRDPVFSFRHGNLRHWIEEKTHGEWQADQVRSITLETVRGGGADAVAEELMQANNGEPIVVNAACYDDLEVLVIGLASAESGGKRFIYRCAASFVKARGGFQDRPLLTVEEMKPGEGPCLVVVGSYVEKTSQQLNELLSSKLAVGVELRVDRLLDAKTRDAAIRRVAAQTNALLGEQNAVVYTSRAQYDAHGESFLEVGKLIMSSLCQVVDQIKVQPGSVVAKGGITSIEIARSALGVDQATVLGQILEGVPVWRLGLESRWSGIPYVVFPGNVGNERAICQVVTSLQGQ